MSTDHSPAGAESLLARALERIQALRKLPVSTYRLQFHAGFTFRDAATIVPYLKRLGVTHVYASPYFKATTGSTHGYDLIDHNQLNPELGTQADYDAWLATMADAGLQHILDIVPNHVGVGTNENALWNDVLANGASSEFAGFFDIAWQDGPRQGLQGKLILPVLGAPYGQTLQQGELRLTFEDGRFYVRYYERRFPISDASASVVLDAATDGDIESALAAFSGNPNTPESFDRSHRLLEQQNYRLTFWRVASDELNYRRFFDIDTLAAIRMENPEVFESTHRLLFDLLSTGRVAGVRIDHPDGLYDPRQYFERLQRQYVIEVAKELFHQSNPFHGANWNVARQQLTDLMDRSPAATVGRHAPLYAVAEKILAADEPLPAEWPVHGTTGYDFLIKVNGLFVRQDQADAFTKLYQSLTGETTSFDDLVYKNKHRILETSLAGELTMLSNRFDRHAQLDRMSRDITLSAIRTALHEVIACFPVYRTYTTDFGVREADAPLTLAAIDHARKHNRDIAQAVFDFLRDTLLLRYPTTLSEAQRAEQRRMVIRFQQLTAPVTAKGIEDTAFYLYHRLISLNEVGGDPARFGTSSEELHQYFSDRQAHWPYALSTLSTHDTKRSEDVRARINVLSEMPAAWSERVWHWQQLNERHRRDIDGVAVPDQNEEYLLYQTLVGVWPIEPMDAPARVALCRRVQEFMQKALREAKQHSSWTAVNTDYEKAIEEFIAAIFDERGTREFSADFTAFQRTISACGLLNSLSQTVLKLTAPGVPDTYQGTELWDFSLVDPDNRRPVDFEKRQQLLHEIDARLAPVDQPSRESFVAELAEHSTDGRIKLFAVAQTLRLRARYPKLFSEGEYIPLKTSGTLSEQLFAFARREQEQWAIVIVARFQSSLHDEWKNVRDLWLDTSISLPPTLAGTALYDVYTGRSIVVPNADERAPRMLVADLFSVLRVAVLTSAQLDGI